MRQTTNYKLPSWDSDDRILRTDFNDLTDKTDKALNANAQAISGETAARASAIAAEASARTSAVAELTAAMALKGNCQIYHTSYVGDGTRIRTMTFPGKPLLVVVQGGTLVCHGTQGNNIFLCTAPGGYGRNCEATWSGNSLTWEGNLPYNGNEADTAYFLVALIAVDE